MVDRKGWRVFIARGMHKMWMRGLLVAALVLLPLVSGCGGGGEAQEEQGKQTAGQEEKGTQTAGQAEESKQTAVAGQVKIIYEDDAIKPKNRDVVEQLRKSGMLERTADWTNEVVALPHDLEVRVTDDVPEGVTDQVTQPDGRTIFVTAAWLTDTHEVLSKVVKDVNRPAVFPKEKFNADDLNVLANQYIFGHEMGHALTRHLMIPLTGFEEDTADGFASFYNVNEEGSDPVIAAAMLFDEIARQQGELTTEHFASDHAITQQRVYNFICLLDGSDPEKWQGPLVDEGYLPESRAPLCPMEWAQLNHGWWTVLEPHFTEAYSSRAPKPKSRRASSSSWKTRPSRKSSRRYAPGTERRRGAMPLRLYRWGRSYYASALLHAPIHRSAWNKNSANFAVAIELPGGKARRRRLLKSWCGSGGKPCRWRNAVRPAVRASRGHRWGVTVCRLPP
jgi:hypothetical protein